MQWICWHRTFPRASVAEGASGVTRNEKSSPHSRRDAARRSMARWAVPVVIMFLAAGCKHDSGTSSVPDSGVEVPPPTGEGGPLAPPDIGQSPDEMVTLAWTAPTTWSTGGALAPSQIAGFRIYELESACGPRRLITDVEDPTQTQVTIGPLEAGEHLIGIAAYGTDIEGPLALGKVTVAEP